MQAAGHSITRWQADAVTRLAHFDSVTARFLLDGRGNPDEVRFAMDGLRAIERWINDSLPSAERAEVRRFEFLIRIEDSEFHQPLLRPHLAPEEHSPQICEQPTGGLRSLRAGLLSLEADELDELGTRLGIPPHDRDDETARDQLNESIVGTLRDDHLLAILLATLDGQAQQVLFELVRGQLSTSDLELLSRPVPLQLVVGGAPMRAPNPLEMLRECGLLFGQGVDVWVPVELQPRIHGVLRGLGL